MLVLERCTGNSCFRTQVGGSRGLHADIRLHLTFAQTTYT